MLKRLLPLLAAVVALSGAALWAAPEKTLDVYFIDVEGGQSTLFVSPSGQSMLIDAGWPGTRDADRIMAVVKQAGISQIDYLILTHYHVDHAGGLPELASRIPIRNFVDHGPTFDPLVNVPQYYAAYVAVRDKGHHILARPGEKDSDQWHRRAGYLGSRQNDSRTIAGCRSRKPNVRRFPAER